MRSTSRRPARWFCSLSALACLYLVMGCSDPLDEVWQLSGYRVLGVTNEPAESAPGESVTLTLASADNTVRPVTTFWFLCAERISALASAAGGSAGSAFGGCPMGSTQIAIGPTAQFTAPMAGHGTLDTQGREAYSVLGFSCAGGSLRLPNSSNPLPQCVGTHASGTVFQRSLLLRSGATLNPLNHNPTLAALRFGEPGALSDLPSDAPRVVPHCADVSHHAGCTHWQFELLFTTESREHYHAPDPLSGQLTDYTERLTVAYLISDGAMDAGFRSDSASTPASLMANAWWAPDHAGTVTVWVYGNDGRNGFEVASRQITVQ